MLAGRTENVEWNVENVFLNIENVFLSIENVDGSIDGCCMLISIKKPMFSAK
jgi:hypothetical protein